MTPKIHDHQKAPAMMASPRTYATGTTMCRKAGSSYASSTSMTGA